MESARSVEFDYSVWRLKDVAVSSRDINKRSNDGALNRPSVCLSSPNVKCEFAKV